MLQSLAEELSIWTIEDVTLRELQGQRLMRQAQFNALLAEVNQRGAAVQDTTALYAAVCRAAVDLAAMRLAWIGRPDPDSGLFEVLAASGVVDYLRNVAISCRAEVAGGNGPTGIAWREDHAVFASRYKTMDLSRQWSEQADLYGFGAFAAVPIHQQGRVAAVLTVYCVQEEVFDNDAQARLGDLVASIERGLDSLEQRERIAHLQSLYQALMTEGEVVLQATSSLEMLQRTCDRLVQGTQFHAAWVGQPDHDGLFQVLASAGSGASQLHTLAINIHDEAHTPPMTRAWNEKRLCYNNDHLADPLLAQWRPFLVTHCWHAEMAVPVERDGAVWAVLVIISPQREVFDGNTISLCQRVAELLGHGLDELDLKARLNDLQSEEAHRARHDALTGLPNRLALELHLPKAIARAKRHDRVLAVGILDLDDFKPVNDTWGHEAGDRLLQGLSQRLQSRLREYDFLARLGGDEFVIVLEDLDSDAVQLQLSAAMARLHEAVETPFELGFGNQGKVDMSLGLALYPHDAQDADSLLRQADAAMYQSKQHKSQRSQWWCLGAGSETQPEREPVFDVYGAQAAALLTRSEESFQSVAAQFVDNFYDDLGANPPVREILQALSASELAHLKLAQQQHLCFLLHGQTTRAMIQQRGLQLGQAHTLVGVSSAWLSGSLAVFRSLLREHLNQNLLPARERYRLVQAAEARVQEDIQAELHAGQELIDAYLRALIQPQPAETMLWADIVPLELGHIAALPGVMACELMHQNAEGVFEVEASAGLRAEETRQILSQPGMQPVLDTRKTTGRGLIAAAWHSGEITHTASYGNDERTAPWHAQVLALGMRSLVAIPIPLAPHPPALVLVIMGAYPHQFESSWITQFTASLQQRWSSIWLRCSNPAAASVLEQETAQSYRQQLFSGGLRMHVQPVVDLRDGSLFKVEALARLYMDDGRIIWPGSFLPLLGTTELDSLFRMGLDQALYQLTQWDEQGLHIGVSINLAPSTLLDSGCARWVEQALQRYGVEPQRLTLELLESQKINDGLQDLAIAQLKQLGVRLAMDDLGSGYSSLQRLSALPFNTIKVDQGLLLHIRDNPVQILSLISTIIQMGHDFERDVVVEGLQDDDLIEAVSILGAHYGQGFGLGRPMDAADLLEWAQQNAHCVPRAEIQSYLGALAFHWKFAHEKHRHKPTSWPDCALTGFLARQGLQNSPVADWHRQVHEGGDVRQCSQKIIDWLVARVRDPGRAVGNLD